MPRRCVRQLRKHCTERCAAIARSRSGNAALSGISLFNTPLISSIVGTRGSFFGSFGDDTSFAGFCCTIPSRASHLYIDRNDASARATETLLSPFES